MAMPTSMRHGRRPGLLLGTPEEIRRELLSRIEEFKMTYYMVSLPNEQSVKLFAAEVMPDVCRIE